MSNEIQFLLYNMPDADGKVQVVIKGETLSFFLLFLCNFASIIYNVYT